MAKFGIDSNMVFDADGKSVATRLSDHDTSLDGLTTSLAERPSYDEMNTKVAQIVSGAPKNVYTTLSALQSAKPSGDTGIYVVTGNIKEVDTLTVSSAPTASGNVTVTLNGVATNIPVTIGTAEVDTLTISAGATASGNITITLNGVATNVAVVAGDTAGAIGDKIRATTFSGWTVGGTAGSATVTFTKTSIGVVSAPTYSAGTTGTTGSIARTTTGAAADDVNGVATKIRNTTFSGWTPGGTASNVTFTKTTAGTNTAPSYSAGSTGTTGAMSVTTQGVDPDGQWYYWNGTTWTTGGVFLSQQDISVRNDLYTQSENLLDPTKLLVGYDIYTWNLANLTTSAYTYASANFVVTPVLPGVAGEQYCLFDSTGKALGITNIIFFDNTGKYLSETTGVNSGNVITLPAGAAFWSCSTSKTILPAMIVKTGSRTTRTYVPYGYIFKGVTTSALNTSLAGTQANIDKVSNYLKFRGSSILDLDNILNDTDLATWKTTDAESTYASTGKYTTPLTSVVSGEIYRTVNKNGTYSTSIGTIMYFDSNKNVVSYENTKTVITIPAGVSYVRFAFVNSENLPDAIVKVSSVDSIPTYQPYYIDNFQRAVINEKPLDVIEKSGGYTSIFHKIGVVGDSLASGAIQISSDGIALDRPEYSWGASIARATGCTVLNFSQGGMQAARWNTDTLGQNAVLPENLCTAYIIALGNNDQSLTIGTSADINLSDYHQNANSFYGNYAKIIQRLKEVQPKARFFLTIYPYKTWVVSGINQAIKDICAMFSYCYLIDLYQYSPFVYGAPNPYMTGSIHLNTIGYQRWAWQIMSYIDYIVRNKMSDFVDVELIGTSYTMDSTYVGN
jgi:lysophospholipase L1-like esterase